MAQGVRVPQCADSWHALRPCPRSQLANLLKEHCLVAGGDTNVSQWLKDEGSDASLSSILKVPRAFLHDHLVLPHWHTVHHAVRTLRMPACSVLKVLR